MPHKEKTCLWCVNSLVTCWQGTTPHEGETFPVAEVSPHFAFTTAQVFGEISGILVGSGPEWNLLEELGTRLDIWWVLLNGTALYLHYFHSPALSPTFVHNNVSAGKMWSVKHSRKCFPFLLSESCEIVSSRKKLVAAEPWWFGLLEMWVLAWNVRCVLYCTYHFQRRANVTNAGIGIQSMRSNSERIHQCEPWIFRTQLTKCLTHGSSREKDVCPQKQ